MANNIFDFVPFVGRVERIGLNSARTLIICGTSFMSLELPNSGSSIAISHGYSLSTVKFKLVNIPGLVYNQPEFEGCFAPWEWAIFHMDDKVSIGFQNNSEVVLGVLNPVNGNNPQMATWKYPEKEGFYFFNVIPAVGSKWKKPTEFGPDGQPEYLKENQSGSISFFINWNNDNSDNKTFKISIE